MKKEQTTRMWHWFLRHKIWTAIIIIILVAALATVLFVALKPHKTEISLNGAVKEYQVKLPELKKAANANPDDATARTNYGIALYATGDLEEAKKQYEKAITLNKDDPVTFNNLGNVYRDLQQVEKAVEAYKQSITLNPKSINTYANLANLQLYSQNKPQDAINTYKDGLKQLPDNSQLELLLGVAYEQAKDTVNAKKIYEHILSYSKDNKPAQAALERLAE